MAVESNIIGEVFTNLPEFLGIVQIIIYIALVLFFGSIIMLGFRAYIHWIVRILIRLGVGALALIAGLALAPLLPLAALFGPTLAPFLPIFQVDVLIGGIVSSIIIGICLYMITFELIDAKKIERRIESLRKKLDKARRRKPTQQVKFIRIGGIVLVAVFLIFSLVNFRGFPDPMALIAAAVGIEPDEFSDLLSGFSGFGDGGLSGECIDAATLLARYQEELPTLLQMHEDAVLEQAFEATSGSPLQQMFSAELEGTTVVLAIMENGDNCFATATEVCVCGQLEG